MKKFFAFLFNWGFLIPLAAVIVAFALSNRQAVTIDLWPLDMDLSQPLYLVVLLSLLAGLLIGMGVMWVSAGRARMRARREAYRAKTLERELANRQSASAGGLPGTPRSSVPSTGRDAA